MRHRSTLAATALVTLALTACSSPDVPHAAAPAPAPQASPSPAPSPPAREPWSLDDATAGSALLTPAELGVTWVTIDDRIDNARPGDLEGAGDIFSPASCEQVERLLYDPTAVDATPLSRAHVAMSDDQWAFAYETILTGDAAGPAAIAVLEDAVKSCATYTRTSPDAMTSTFTLSTLAVPLLGDGSAGVRLQDSAVHDGAPLAMTLDVIVTYCDQVTIAVARGSFEPLDRADSIALARLAHAKVAQVAQ